MNAFPLTANGKIDVAALPLPEEKTNCPANHALSPMKSLFERLLECPAEDESLDFRLMGGDSLRVIRLATEIERNFGYRLAPADFEGTLSIAGLSARIAGGGKVRKDRDWPAEWFAAASSWTTPDQAERVTGFPGWRLNENADRGDPILVWLAAGAFDATMPIHLAGRRTTYVVPGGNLIVPTHRKALDEWLPGVVAALRRSLDGRPVVMGGFCASGILAVAWAAELERQGTEVRGVIAVDAPADARLCRRWYLGVLGWHELFRTVGRPGWAGGLVRKMRSLVARVTHAPGPVRDRTGSHRFSLEEVPSWSGPFRLSMSAQAWRSRWLLGRTFGWDAARFPRLEMHRIAGNHFNCLSTNPGEALLPADDPYFQLSCDAA